MTKYNLSSIMTRAWEIKHQDSRYIFSLCLKMAWAEAKAPKVYKNVVVATYDDFNARRYGRPWAALVNDQGRLDFSSNVAGYTGCAPRGEGGDLYIYAPVENQVYAYGQKDYRKGGSNYKYVQYQNGKFVPVEKTDLLRAIA